MTDPPDKKCKDVPIRKTEALAKLDDAQLKQAILEEVINSLSENKLPGTLVAMVARLFLNHASQVVAVDPEGNPVAAPEEIQNKLQAFRDLPLNQTYLVTVYVSFVRLIDGWLKLSTGAHVDCRSVHPNPPPVDDSGMFLYLSELTRLQRVEWASQFIEIQRQQEARQGPDTAGGWRRYIPGEVYDSLMFVGHPYYGFPNDGIWMTPDGQLYWVNEHVYALKLLQEVARKAEKLVTAELELAALLGAATVMPVLPGLLQEFSVAARFWAYANPAKAMTAAFTTLEIGLMAAGETIPPGINPGDMVIAAMQSELKSATMVVASVEKQVGKRLVLRAVSRRLLTKSLVWALPKKGIFIIDKAATPAWKMLLEAAAQETKLDFFRSPLTGKEIARFTASLIYAGFRGLKNETARDAVRLIQRSDDPLIRRAFALFGRDSSAYKHFVYALGSTASLRREGRFTLRAALYALQKYARGNPDVAMGFEVNLSLGEWRAGGTVLPGIIRRVDFWLQGMIIEFKTAKFDRRWATGFRTRSDSQLFGELARDLLLKISDRSSLAASLSRIKWLLDEQHLFGRELQFLERQLLSREIGLRLFAALKAEGAFVGYPLLKEIEVALIDIVELI